MSNINKRKLASLHIHVFEDEYDEYVKYADKIIKLISKNKPIPAALFKKLYSFHKYVNLKLQKKFENSTIRFKLIDEFTETVYNKFKKNHNFNITTEHKIKVVHEWARFRYSSPIHYEEHSLQKMIRLLFIKLIDESGKPMMFKSKTEGFLFVYPVLLKYFNESYSQQIEKPVDYEYKLGAIGAHSLQLIGVPLKPDTTIILNSVADLHESIQHIISKYFPSKKPRK